MYSSGMCLILTGLLFNIFGLIIAADDAYNRLMDKVKDLQDKLLYTKGKEKRQEIKNIVSNIQEVGPFSGLGYFDITRKTLTSMVSVSITYIIIIVQFKISIQ